MSFWACFHSRARRFALGSGLRRSRALWERELLENFSTTSFFFHYQCKYHPQTVEMSVDVHVYLHLVRADVELAEDVTQEVLHLVPGVDAVGAVQHDDDVHVGGAPCRMWEIKKGLVG